MGQIEARNSKVIREQMAKEGWRDASGFAPQKEPTQITLSSGAMKALSKTAKHYEAVGKPGESFLGGMAARGYSTLQESGDQKGGVYMERGFSDTGMTPAGQQRAMEGRAAEMRTQGNRMVRETESTTGAYPTQFRNVFGTASDVATRSAIDQAREDERVMRSAEVVPRPTPSPSAPPRPSAIPVMRGAPGKPRADNSLRDWQDNVSGEDSGDIGADMREFLRKQTAGGKQAEFVEPRVSKFRSRIRSLSQIEPKATGLALPSTWTIEKPPASRLSFGRAPNSRLVIQKPTNR